MDSRGSEDVVDEEEGVGEGDGEGFLRGLRGGLVEPVFGRAIRRGLASRERE